MALLIDTIEPDRVRRAMDAEGTALFLEAATKVFEITNVRDLLGRMDYIKRIEGEVPFEVDFTKFPNVAPPYGAYWFEWAANPDDFMVAGFGLTRVGAWIVTDDHDTDPRIPEDQWRLGISSMIPTGGPLPVSLSHSSLLIDRKTGVVVREADPLRMLDGALSTLRRRERSRSTQVDPETSEVVATARQMIADGDIEGVQRLYAENETKIEAAKADLAVTIEKQREVWEAWLRAFLYPPILMAHSLLGCKNVDTQTHRRDPKLVKAREKRGKMPVVRFETLTIRPTGGGGDTGEGFAVGDGQRALHLVRGHFKTFTAEKPLLGKHVGTYWWSPRVRGAAANGVVVKDYKIGESK